MPSVIEICNLALAHIGQGPINSLEELSPQAKKCNLFYTNTRDSLLRQFPWNFSTRNILLSQVDDSIPGWAYIYQHPPTALWVRKVFTKDNVDPEIPNEYEIISTGTEKYICCDLLQAYAKCTIRIEDTTLFDPLFVDVFTYKLAMDLCMPLTNSSTKTQEIMTKLQTATSMAMMAGAVEGNQKKTIAQQPKSSRSYITSMR